MERGQKKFKKEISANITWISIDLAKRELDISTSGFDVPEGKKNKFKNLHSNITIIFT